MGTTDSRDRQVGMAIQAGRGALNGDAAVANARILSRGTQRSVVRNGSRKGAHGSVVSTTQAQKGHASVFSMTQPQESAPY